MSDALPLPPRPNLEQYKKLAKDLQKACKSGDTAAFRDWARRWMEILARLRGRAATPEDLEGIRQRAQQVERHLNKIQKANERLARCILASAQLLLARCHGFASWPRFAQHLKALKAAGSPVSKFELAADAIVEGELKALENLLRESPDLVRARSTREHRSTLLHYVSANGIEDFRQKTPQNSVEIAKLLLDAGAEVNAESDAYGGRSTTLGLTATSCHPEAAGLSIPLMELLISRGAILDGPDGGSAVVSCLRNGRGEAAKFLASRGARLDLEGAAGVGRLDIVASFFDDEGQLRPTATLEQTKAGFAWASEFGQTAVVDSLLQRGMHLDAKLPPHGETALHWAAHGGHPITVRLLLERGARIDAKDESFDGTPLEWAMHAWGNASERAVRGDYYQVVALLVRAGATLNPRWLEGDDEGRPHAFRKLRSDPRMRAALRGEMPP